MAKIFLDANALIDVSHRNTKHNQNLNNQEVYYSILSVHILFYALKINVPNSIIQKNIASFIPIDLDKNIISLALQGPTNDLEDNIQLQSASDASCDYFLTRDKKLLKLKYFGKTQIVSKLS